MPCKHEGGSDPCIRRKDTKACIARHQLYARTVQQSGGKSVSGHGTGRLTAAAELLVCADLSGRGFEVTTPVSPTAVHDVHVELPSVGWKGVQVKTGTVNRNTGTLSTYRKVHHASPILAVVFVPTKRIEYRAGTEPLPVELQ